MSLVGVLKASEISEAEVSAGEDIDMAVQGIGGFEKSFAKVGCCMREL